MSTTVWLAAGVRTPFARVDGPFAHRDSLALCVPVVQAMAERVHGPIDFGVWGAVILNLAYNDLAREKYGSRPGSIPACPPSRPPCSAARAWSPSSVTAIPRLLARHAASPWGIP